MEAYIPLLRLEQLHIMAGMPYGLSAMLKEGHKHLDEAVIKNIEACKQLSVLTRTSMGPQGGLRTSFQ